MLKIICITTGKCSCQKGECSGVKMQHFPLEVLWSGVIEQHKMEIPKYSSLEVPQRWFWDSTWAKIHSLHGLHMLQGCTMKLCLQPQSHTDKRAFLHNWGKNFTLAPFCRSISTIAFPIPIAAPVTTAILPFKAISAAQSEERRLWGNPDPQEIKKIWSERRWCAFNLPPPTRKIYQTSRNMREVQP